MSIAAVAIGRNEGERLVRCLKSLADQCQPVVYVDSGSTDGSGKRASELGATVIALDLSTAFTAARARNAGLEHVLNTTPGAKYVQFIDGDCEMNPHWLRGAVAAFDAHTNVAIVLGRRRERHPQASRYNRLCDMEWEIPPGTVDYCGGDILARVSALREVGGYRADLIAGEEPEMCVRLRQAGWQVLCIDQEMTLHDAAMTRFGQWWKRTLRGGHAFAEGAWLHGSLRGGHFVRNVYRALLWGIVVPGLGLLSVLAAVIWPWAAAAAVLLALAICVSGLRALRWRRSLGDGFSDSVLYAVFCVIGKLPEALGVLRFHTLRLRNRRGGLVEYK